MGEIRFYEGNELKRVLKVVNGKLKLLDPLGNEVKDLEAEVTAVKKKFIKIKSINENNELVYEEDGVEKTVAPATIPGSGGSADVYPIYVEEDNTLVIIDDSPSVGVIESETNIIVVPAGTDISQLYWHDSFGLLLFSAESTPFTNVPDGFTYEVVYTMMNSNVNVNVIPRTAYLKHIVYGNDLIITRPSGGELPSA